MKTAPDKCILCNISGKSDVWNGLDILTCPECSLSWRKQFTLPEGHYRNIEVDIEDSKKESRKANAIDQVNTVKNFLPNSNICDLGCSDGWFLHVLDERGYKDCIGIEPGERGLGLSREKGLNVIEGTIDNLPQIIAGKKLESITLFHVLEHLNDPKNALKIIHDSLKKEGILILETPNADAPLQRVTDHKNHLIYPEHLFYWNEKSLRKILEQNGFQVLSVRRRSFNWRNASISSSLLRLGLKLNKKETPKKLKTNTLKEVNLDKGDSLIGSVIRTILIYLTHFLRRDDYILIIARSRL